MKQEKNFDFLSSGYCSNKMQSHHRSQKVDWSPRDM